MQDQVSRLLVENAINNQIGLPEGSVHLKLPSLHPTWWGGRQVVIDTLVTEPFAIIGAVAALMVARRDLRLRSFYIILLAATVLLSGM